MKNSLPLTVLINYSCTQHCLHIAIEAGMYRGLLLIQGLRCNTLHLRQRCATIVDALRSQVQHPILFAGAAAEGHQIKLLLLLRKIIFCHGKISLHLALCHLLRRNLPAEAAQIIKLVPFFWQIHAQARSRRYQIHIALLIRSPHRLRCSRPRRQARTAEAGQQQKINQTPKHRKHLLIYSTK